MDKQGQGLPITTVILAILGIVVLVILFAIMTGRLTIFAGAANECPGRCIASDLKGASPVSGILTQGDESNFACGDFEKKLYGNFIAGVRGSDGKEPIPCDQSCCQRLA